jgi:general stress protein YciG
MAERGQSEKTDAINQRNPEQGEETSRTNSDISDDERSKSSERKGTSNRGFAAMNSEKQKQIASEGGRAAHRQGVAHEWSKDEAREAGRKGGQIVSRNREHMSEIGRKGGQNSGQRRQKDAGERSE